MNMYRGIEAIPVLAKAGAVVPMQEETDAVSVCGNPDRLVLKMFAGADGRFVLMKTTTFPVIMKRESVWKPD